MNAIGKPSPPIVSNDQQTAPTDAVARDDRRPANTFGQRQLSPEQWDHVGQQLSLKERELSVCQLLFDCMTRQQIANQLEISNRTVRHHMEQIHHKLEVKNRVGVVLKIIQQRDLEAAASAQA